MSRRKEDFEEEAFAVRTLRKIKNLSLGISEERLRKYDDYIVAVQYDSSFGESVSNQLLAESHEEARLNGEEWFGNSLVGKEIGPNQVRYAEAYVKLVNKRLSKFCDLVYKAGYARKISEVSESGPYLWVAECFDSRSDIVKIFMAAEQKFQERIFHKSAQESEREEIREICLSSTHLRVRSAMLPETRDEDILKNRGNVFKMAVYHSAYTALCKLHETNVGEDTLFYDSGERKAELFEEYCLELEKNQEPRDVGPGYGKGVFNKDSVFINELSRKKMELWESLSERMMMPDVELPGLKVFSSRGITLDDIFGEQYPLHACAVLSQDTVFNEKAINSTEIITSGGLINEKGMAYDGSGFRVFKDNKKTMRIARTGTKWTLWFQVFAVLCLTLFCGVSAEERQTFCGGDMPACVNTTTPYFLKTIPLEIDEKTGKIGRTQIHNTKFAEYKLGNKTVNTNCLTSGVDAVYVRSFTTHGVVSAPLTEGIFGKCYNSLGEPLNLCPGSIRIDFQLNETAEIAHVSANSADVITVTNWGPHVTAAVHKTIFGGSGVWLELGMLNPNENTLSISIERLGTEALPFWRISLKLNDNPDATTDTAAVNTFNTGSTHWNFRFQSTVFPFTDSGIPGVMKANVVNINRADFYKITSVSILNGMTKIAEERAYNLLGGVVFDKIPVNDYSPTTGIYSEDMYHFSQAAAGGKQQIRKCPPRKIPLQIPVVNSIKQYETAVCTSQVHNSTVCDNACALGTRGVPEINCYGDQHYCRLKNSITSLDKSCSFGQTPPNACFCLSVSHNHNSIRGDGISMKPKIINTNLIEIDRTAELRSALTSTKQAFHYEGQDIKSLGPQNWNVKTSRRLLSFEQQVNEDSFSNLQFKVTNDDSLALIVQQDMSAACSDCTESTVYLMFISVASMEDARSSCVVRGKLTTCFLPEVVKDLSCRISVVIKTPGELILFRETFHRRLPEVCPTVGFWFWQVFEYWSCASNFARSFSIIQLISLICAALTIAGFGLEKYVKIMDLLKAVKERCCCRKKKVETAEDDVLLKDILTDYKPGPSFYNESSKGIRPTKLVLSVVLLICFTFELPAFNLTKVFASRVCSNGMFINTKVGSCTSGPNGEKCRLGFNTVSELSKGSDALCLPFGDSGSKIKSGTLFFDVLSVFREDEYKPVYHGSNYVPVSDSQRYCAESKPCKDVGSGITGESNPGGIFSALVMNNPGKTTMHASSGGAANGCWLVSDACTYSRYAFSVLSAGTYTVMQRSENKAYIIEGRLLLNNGSSSIELWKGSISSNFPVEAEPFILRIPEVLTSLQITDNLPKYVIKFNSELPKLPETHDDFGYNYNRTVVPDIEAKTMFAMIDERFVSEPGKPTRGLYGDLQTAKEYPVNSDWVWDTAMVAVIQSKHDTFTFAESPFNLLAGKLMVLPGELDRTYTTFDGMTLRRHYTVMPISLMVSISTTKDIEFMSTHMTVAPRARNPKTTLTGVTKQSGGCSVELDLDSRLESGPVFLNSSLDSNMFKFIDPMPIAPLSTNPAKTVVSCTCALSTYEAFTISACTAISCADFQVDRAALSKTDMTGITTNMESKTVIRLNGNEAEESGFSVLEDKFDSFWDPFASIFGFRGFTGALKTAAILFATLIASVVSYKLTTLYLQNSIEANRAKIADKQSYERLSVDEDEKPKRKSGCCEQIGKLFKKKEPSDVS